MIQRLFKPFGIIGPVQIKTGEASIVNNPKSGLTLVELMVVMVLSIILVGAAFMTYIAHNKAGTEQARVLVLQQDARAVMEMIHRDFRNSGCNPNNATMLALNANSSGLTSISMNMDLNGDRDTGDPGEIVTYRLNGTSVQRSDQGVITPLVNNASVFQITYFDNTNQPIAPTGPGGFLTAAEAQRVLSIEVRLDLQSQMPDPDTGRRDVRSLTRRMQSRNQEILFK